MRVYGVGDTTRRLLRDNDITQQQVAEWINRDQGYVSRCLNEQLEFTPHELHVIANKLAKHKGYVRMIRCYLIGSAIEPVIVDIRV